MVNSFPIMRNLGRASVQMFSSLSVRRWFFAIYAVAWTISLEVPMPIQLPPDSDYREPLFTFSKSVHVAAYALFTILAASMRLPPWQRGVVLGLIVAHTMLTEYFQWVLADICHRTGQWRDVGLDLIGIMLGFALSWKWWLK
jgi:hypothetical protein